MNPLRYCVRCLYPETKPDIWFDEEGVCSACLNFDARRNIDWAEREKDFTTLIDGYRNPDGYDCVVPVSGGKDSHYQTIKLLEYGLNPLCVTATTDSLSDIGRRNIENLKSLGADYIEVSLNPKVRRQMNRIGLEQVGDISWPEHVAIFTVPIRVALQHDIKLVVWGENSQNEYGGPEAAAIGSTLDKRWLQEFGGLLGLRVSDLPFESRELIQYTYPEDMGGLRGIFLGHYFPWDGYENAVRARAHGFEWYHEKVEGSIVGYENLDNHQTGIHDYMKWLKYGFGRATDIACNHIRRGRMERDEAMLLVRERDGMFPSRCLGKPLVETLFEIDMMTDEFVKICNEFTNKKLFRLTEAPRPTPLFDLC